MPLAAQEEEEEEDDSNTRAAKADGTRCGRNVFDTELGVCKCHVDWARKAEGIHGAEGEGGGGA